MVGRRRGASKLGCLFTVLVVTAIAYFAFGSGEVVLRYYRFRDAMEQEARFARHYTDDDIKKRLRSLADSLGLPPEAGQVRVRRSATRITISAAYDETVELPMFVRVVRLNPTVTGAL